MVSMFRLQGAKPLPADVDPPCTRTQKRGAEQHVAELLKENGAGVRTSGKKQYCAAYLNTLNWACMEAEKEAAASGTQVPPGWYVHYHYVKEVAPRILEGLFGMKLTAQDWESIGQVGELYSKSRGKFGEAAKFAGDDKRKSEVVTDEVVWWTKVYLYEQYSQMLQLATKLPELDAAHASYLAEEAAWLEAGGSVKDMVDQPKWELKLQTQKENTNAPEGGDKAPGNLRGGDA